MSTSPTIPSAGSAQTGAMPLSRFGFAKSRKSSCSLCHRRKIKCDQIRPACSSCVRKAKFCQYDDEPGSIYTLDVAPSSAWHHSPPGNGFNPASSQPGSQMHGGPKNGAGWVTASGSTNSITGTPAGNGTNGKTKQAIRDRILSGFDSDSEADADEKGGRVIGTQALPAMRPPESQTEFSDTRMVTASSAERSLVNGRHSDNGDRERTGSSGSQVAPTPDLNRKPTVLSPSKKRSPSRSPDHLDELDELADEGDELVESPRQTSVPLAVNGEKERRASQSEGAPKRDRDISIDDEISGELLELASAPVHRPKKSRPSTSRQSGSYTGPSPSRQGPAPSSTLPPQQQPSASSARSHGQQGQHQSSRTHQASSGQQNYPSTPSSAPSHANSYTISLMSLLSALPSSDTQTILFNTFFSDPFLSSGTSLLRPQYLDDFRMLIKRRNHGRLREGDATTLANAFAFLAVSLRILPEETSRLLLAAVPVLPPSANAHGNGWSASPSSPGPVYPRSLSRILAALPPLANDPTPLHRRYFDLALLTSQIAEQSDPPSVMLVMLKLVLYRYSALGFKTDRLLPAGGWLAQGIKVAQALGMGKEWEGIPQGERELRRRVMWALYIADRQHSYMTSFPYTILDIHNLIALPSPISEADLYTIPPDAPALPAHSTDAAPTPCTALFIQAHLARLITPVLDSFATVSPAGTPHELVLRFDSSLNAFQEALPSYLRFFPLTNTQFDSQHPYLPPHRIHLHATLLAYRLGVHRSHLPQYMDPATPVAARKLIAQLCLATLRVHRSARMLDAKVAPRLFDPACVFEAAATLGLVMHVDKTMASVTHLSEEWLTMRAAAAEAIELLDGVAQWADVGGIARKATIVLREMMLRVDAAVDRPMNRHSVVRGTSGNQGSPVASPVKQAEQVSTPHSPRRSPSPQASSSPTAAAADHVLAWLDHWRGANLEYLMREAEWINGWEAIIGTM